MTLRKHQTKLSQTLLTYISLNAFNLSLPWLQLGKWDSKIEENVHSYASWLLSTLWNPRAVRTISIHSFLPNQMQIRFSWSLWRSLSGALLVTLHSIGAKLILWLVRYPRSNDFKGDINQRKMLESSMILCMYLKISVEFSYAFFSLLYYIISGVEFWSWAQKEAQANFHGSNKVAIIIMMLFLLFRMLRWLEMNCEN